MFEPVDIKSVLIREKEKHGAAEKLLFEAESLVKAGNSSDKEVHDRIFSRPDKKAGLYSSSMESDKDNIFPLEAIREICINYRLRFLDSWLFKGDIPNEAILKVHEFERRHNICVKQFKIMAPRKLFKLQDPHEDPLLFADLGNGNYYLLHRWGNELNWYRKILTIPFRTVVSLLATIAVVCLSLALGIPDDLLAPSAKYANRIDSLRFFIFMHTFIMFTGVTLFICFLRKRGVSELEWNDPYSH
jgi:hypothetical protein